MSLVEERQDGRADVVLEFAIGKKVAKVECTIVSNDQAVNT